MDEELEGKEEQRLIEDTRRRIAIRIAHNMDNLIDALFDIANSVEEDAKVRLSAINMLLERSLPKLGVEHSEKSETEDTGSSRAIRAELEKLLMDDEDDDLGMAEVG